MIYTNLHQCSSPLYCGNFTETCVRQRSMSTPTSTLCTRIVFRISYINSLLALPQKSLHRSSGWYFVGTFLLSWFNFFIWIHMICLQRLWCQRFQNRSRMLASSMSTVQSFNSVSVQWSAGCRCSNARRQNVARSSCLFGPMDLVLYLSVVEWRQALLRVSAPGDTSPTVTTFSTSTLTVIATANLINVLPFCSYLREPIRFMLTLKRRPFSLQHPNFGRPTGAHCRTAFLWFNLLFPSFAEYYRSHLDLCILQLKTAFSGTIIIEVADCHFHVEWKSATSVMLIYRVMLTIVSTSPLQCSKTL